MNTDLVSSLTAARSAQTQQSATIALMRQAQETETALVQAVDAAVRAAPPPGQGLKVDKLA